MIIVFELGTLTLYDVLSCTKSAKVRLAVKHVGGLLLPLSQDILQRSSEKKIHILFYRIQLLIWTHCSNRLTNLQKV